MKKKSLFCIIHIIFREILCIFIFSLSHLLYWFTPSLLHCLIVHCPVPHRLTFSLPHCPLPCFPTASLIPVHVALPPYPHPYPPLAIIRIAPLPPYSTVSQRFNWPTSSLPHCSAYPTSPTASPGTLPHCHILSLTHCLTVPSPHFSTAPPSHRSVSSLSHYLTAHCPTAFLVPLQCSLASVDSCLAGLPSNQLPASVLCCTDLALPSSHITPLPQSLLCLSAVLNTVPLPHQPSGSLPALGPIQWKKNSH